MTLQLQYKGFINTPNLWLSDRFGLHQYTLSKELIIFSEQLKTKEKRLGKRVEDYFQFQINNTENTRLVASNLQVKKDKITIGELDALIIENRTPKHIEITYKFYLFNPNIEGSYIHKWIGPNLKDSLIYKLEKIKEKQLPLLYSEYAKHTLKQLKLDTKTIEQNVCFKAQLFIPYKTNVKVNPLNQNCIYGFYFNYAQLPLFKDCMFYIPSKLDWLVEPHYDVDWITYNKTIIEIGHIITSKRSPMVWIKNDDEEITKSFITFW